ncbi:hypothetical protein CC78DRAFT_583604 [Lojkania enalia]|uniref:Uncharacterized protein n=1 Tax=Lojkania enalia TaxID=147567 RepID=A0A9P4K223_9PLEO|nr:hypothetical protein CC78DRAFT_583604 [Didymosphaeria enalia]
MPPKRGLFSLNVDPNTENLLEKIKEHNKDWRERVNVVGHNEPVHDNTSLRIFTKPFEKEVQQSIERIVDENSSRRESTNTSTPSSSSSRKTVIVKPLEEEYDTSDL